MSKSSFSQIKARSKKIALIAPASPFEKAIFDSGVQELKNRKFEVIYSNEVFKRSWGMLPYITNPPEARAEEIMNYFKDPDIAAIVAIRGGYGSNLVADLLDYNLIKNNPKLFIGFSDITYLLHAINKHSDIPTIHGPMPGASTFLKMDKRDLQAYIDIIKNPEKELSLSIQEMDSYNLKSINAKILGGNLTVLTSMLATKHEFNLDDSILFFEDINEPLYKLDRNLSQLKQANKLNNIKGLIFGEFLNADFTNDDILTILDHLDLQQVPTIMNFPTGHGLKNHPVPVGGFCNIDTATETLTLRLYP